MLYACVERFDVMCVRENILSWEGKRTRPYSCRCDNLSTCVQSNQPSGSLALRHYGVLYSSVVSLVTAGVPVPLSQSRSRSSCAIADTVRVQSLREFKARTGTVAAHVRGLRSFLRGRAARAPCSATVRARALCLFPGVVAFDAGSGRGGF
jgi:hypothetical protein